MKDALGGVQTVLVLGGTSELALATVNSLDLRPGATVVLAGRDEAALEKAGAGLSAQVVVRRWDATDVERHPAFLAEVAAEVGDIDLVLAGSSSARTARNSPSRGYIAASVSGATLESLAR